MDNSHNNKILKVKKKKNQTAQTIVQQAINNQ